MEKTTFSALLPFSSVCSFFFLLLLFDFIGFIYFEICYSRQLLWLCSVRTTHFPNIERIYRWLRDVRYCCFHRHRWQQRCRHSHRRSVGSSGKSQATKRNTSYLYGINNNNKKSAINVSECVRTSRNYVSECFMQANHFFFSVLLCFALCGTFVLQ